MIPTPGCQQKVKWTKRDPQGNKMNKCNHSSNSRLIEIFFPQFFGVLICWSCLSHPPKVLEENGNNLHGIVPDDLFCCPLPTYLFLEDGPKAALFSRSIKDKIAMFTFQFSPGSFKYPSSKHILLIEEILVDMVNTPLFTWFYTSQDCAGFLPSINSSTVVSLPFLIGSLKTARPDPVQTLLGL